MMVKMTDIEVKNELLLILKEFVDFCNKHNLKYSLDGGTLIGAIRHKGFIPWDDDIDVMMPREDYVFLRENFKSENVYFLDSYINRRYHQSIGKLISKKTWGYEKPYKKYKNYGVYLDIFPLDYVPNDERLFYEFLYKNKKLTNKCYLMASKYFFVWDYITKKSDYIKNILLIPLSIIRTISYRWIFGFHVILKKIEKFPKMNSVNKIYYNNTFENVSNDDRKMAFVSWNDYKYNMCFTKGDFENSYIFNFEGIKCKVVNNYDNYLKMFYNSDYMKLPPLSKRVKSHHSVFYWRNNKEI